MQKVVELLFIPPEPSWAEHAHALPRNGNAFSVIIPASYDAALEYLATPSAMPDTPGRRAWLALIAPHALPGNSGFDLVRTCLEQNIPTLLLLDAQAPQLADDITRAPFYIGSFDIGYGPETLTRLVNHLKNNKKAKTLAWADSDELRAMLHTELQRCLFKVHSTTDEAAILQILQNNTDVNLLVLAAKTADSRMLPIVRSLRDAHPRNTLSIFCLTDTTQQNSMHTRFLLDGADVCMSFPVSNHDFHIQCTLENARIAQTRKIMAQSARKDLMLSAVSNELTSPLDCIHTHARQLLSSSHGAFSQEQRASVSAISRISTEASQMTHDFLDVSVLEQGRLKLNIEENARLDVLTAERLRQATQMTWGKSLRIRRILSEVSCAFDPARMGQVVDNLIANAIKYTPQGKDIIIRVSQNAEEALLSITNQGEGIPPEERNNLFKPYFTGTAGRNGTQQAVNKRGGAGLGLYIASEIVKAHHGRIWVDSKMGEESTFHIALPLAAPQTVAPGTSNPAPANATESI